MDQGGIRKTGRSGGEPEPASATGSNLLYLECSWCGRRHDASVPQGVSACCSRPLLARYRLEEIARRWRGDPGAAPGSEAAEAARGTRVPPGPAARTLSNTLWRYGELLPASGPPVTLGEGWTPLLGARRLGAELGAANLWIKEEAQNPTGSFKARGLSVAVTMAREHGFRRVAVPTAGNAGLAMAAYAAAAGMGADVFCPRDTPEAFIKGTRLLGADVHLVDGFITDCARLVREGTATEGWMDLSTLREPYRVEGKKIMGFELWEQLGRRLPQVIIYPAGGGTGLVGMWKAFSEMEALGWIGSERPRMIAVQAAGCAPIVRAFHQGAQTAEPWKDPATVASGLRVPAAVGDVLMLKALRESNGTALAVGDDEMVEGSRLLGAREGILASPEGGATVAAAGRLLREGAVNADEDIVLFNTGIALSYLEAY